MLWWEVARGFIALLGIWGNLAAVVVGGTGVRWDTGGCWGRFGGSMALWAKPECQSNRATRYSGALGRVLSTEVLWDTGGIGAFMATGWDCLMEAW